MRVRSRCWHLLANGFAAAREHVRFHSIKSVILLVFVVVIVFCITTYGNNKRLDFCPDERRSRNVKQGFAVSDVGASEARGAKHRLWDDIVTQLV